MTPKISSAYLKTRLHYEPASGLFTWVSNRTRRRVGEVAGSVSAEGYVVISMVGGQLSAHRLAWLYMTGSEAPGPIDHISGDKADNRWSNLRLADAATNAQNRRRSDRDSRTQVLGVRPHGKSGYQAQIKVGRKTLYLGTHKTPELAHAAYLEAKRRHHEGCTL